MIRKQYDKKFGYASFGKIKNLEHCSIYMTKYITKDLEQLPKGSQVYLASKGLKVPEVFDKGFNFASDIDFDFENEYVKIGWC